MLKKIYDELVSIRKELQAIRRSVKPDQEYYIKEREPYSHNYRFVKVSGGLEESLEAK